MLRIGVFSRICQVPVKTLRYYDEIGLHKPDRVDGTTGYRYYSVGQLARLHRIVALRDLGLSLAQIGRMLKDELSVEELQAMLRLRRAQLEQQVLEAQERIERVEARLKTITMEGKMPDYEVVIKEVQAQRVASVREIIPTMEQIGPALDRNFDAAGRFIAERGKCFAGPGVAIWHVEGPTEIDMDVEAALPISKTLESAGGVEVYELPAEQMACLVHRGNFAEFSRSYQALAGWIEQNSYRITGPNREVYLQHDRGNPDDSVTEIQFPVEKN
ncbi:MAG: MerR family transcriptional regulator [Candidatus Latescibacteria bacterium]|nr:MerR family transcriptional regulator [Candidatus Latescibacterota bacterium]